MQPKCKTIIFTAIYKVECLKPLKVVILHIWEHVPNDLLKKILNICGKLFKLIDDDGYKTLP
jgi:hypothetical protein